MQPKTDGITIENNATRNIRTAAALKNRQNRRLPADSEIDDLRLELAGHRRKLPPGNEPSLHGNESDQKKQHDAAQRRGLIYQRRLLARQIHDIRGINVEAPGHPEKQLRLKAA